jgi:hypothetical protein
MPNSLEADWLKVELERELAPASAPEALGERLGLRAVRRREWPRLVAIAAGVVILIAGGFAAGRTTSRDLHQMAAAPKALASCGSCHTL